MRCGEVRRAVIGVGSFFRERLKECSDTTLRSMRAITIIDAPLIKIIDGLSSCGGRPELLRCGVSWNTRRLRG